MDFKSRLGNTKSMWGGVLLGTLAGLILLAVTTRLPRDITLTPNYITRFGIEHWLLLMLVVWAIMAMAAAPFIRFLASGWHERLTEFKGQGRLRGKAIYAYLAQFWRRLLDENPGVTANSLAAEQLLNKIYVTAYGRRAFIAPLICLLVITFISSVLVIQSGIDTCIEHKCVSSPSSGTLTGHFAPMGDLTLPPGAAAAIAGAYLFMVSDAILRARRRIINISDVYWYALRMLLAIPTGLAFSAVVIPGLTSLISFGLGAFPINELMKLLRRITSKSLGGGEDAQVGDQLVQLNGVTVPISATLAAEGVDSIDELIGVDPVLLSIRSGIPFSSILRFASQAVVRLHLGDKANRLELLGLANAYMVAEFICELDAERRLGSTSGPANRRLLDAVEQLKDDKNPTVPSDASVEACFRKISLHGYTRFLVELD